MTKQEFARVMFLTSTFVVSAASVVAVGLFDKMTGVNVSQWVCLLVSVLSVFSLAREATK